MIPAGLDQTYQACLNVVTSSPAHKPNCEFMQDCFSDTQCLSMYENIYNEAKRNTKIRKIESCFEELLPSFYVIGVTVILLPFLLFVFYRLSWCISAHIIMSWINVIFCFQIVNNHFYILIFQKFGFKRCMWGLFLFAKTSSCFTVCDYAHCNSFPVWSLCDSGEIDIEYERLSKCCHCCCSHESASYFWCPEGWWGQKKIVKTYSIQLEIIVPITEVVFSMGHNHWLYTVKLGI